MELPYKEILCKIGLWEIQCKIVLHWKSSARLSYGEIPCKDCLLREILQVLILQFRVPVLYGEKKFPLLYGWVFCLHMY
jgi:hypothetical protein